MATAAGWAARGATLVELMVALVILGLLAGISGLALASLRPTPETAAVGRLAHARAAAIRTGLPVVVADTVGDTTHRMLFLPDGRAIGTGVDPLTGAPGDPR
jgi:prepilin-type N-terminal cleavage/methylation domain-containing protein